jgi:hypothetical protein
MTMSARVNKVSTRERERKQLVNELSEEHGPSWSAQYEPGSFGCHELLDRTMLAAEIVDQYVLTHPACARNREWYALAEKAAAALQELYQRVGAEHLNDQGTEAP